jgi:C_GCAxxG_C_C family probable redox protein
MTRQEVEKRAFDIISSGRNCAESVLQTAILHFQIPSDGTPTRIASCFGGGVGRCQGELCGALAGGLMALGLAFGRDIAGTSCDVAYDLAAEFRKRFITRHGSSTCCDLLEGFGEQEDWSACKQLVADTSGMLLELIEQARATKDGATTD